MTAAEPLKIKRGDTLPAIACILTYVAEDGTETVVPVDDATEIRFILRARNANSPTVSALGTIDDAPTGQVSYAWAPGDTDDAGDYRAEWQLTFAPGQVLTCPNGGWIPVRIVEDLGP